MYNTAAEQTVSLTAADATIRAGSSAGGVGGNIHLYPSAGGSSFIQLEGNTANMRLGLSAVASGDLRLYDVSGGSATIHLNGGTGDISSSTEPLFLNAGSSEDVVLANGGGNVGIGTSSPNHELVVQGNDPAMTIRDDTTDNSANAARLELLERAGGNYDGGGYLWWNGETNKLLVGTKQSGVNTNVLVIDRATSSVGIGTQTPGSYRLAVNGSIRSKEIVVETGWSDFVFEANYNLPTLEEVEAHIGQHGHLQDIPSAAHVAKHGVKVGEMESKLLQKVEELTLHLIDMNKRLGDLECENAQLREGVSQ